MNALVAAIILGVLISIPLALLGAWPLMLLLGNIAIATGMQGLAIGFWQSVIWSFLLGFVIPRGSASSQ